MRVERVGGLTDPPPKLVPYDELGIEEPVKGADGPCPERFGGGCWSGRGLARLRTMLADLIRYADDAWSRCQAPPPKEGP